MIYFVEIVTLTFTMFLKFQLLTVINVSALIYMAFVYFSFIELF